MQAWARPQEACSTPSSLLPFCASSVGAWPSLLEAGSRDEAPQLGLAQESK